MATLESQGKSKSQVSANHSETAGTCRSLCVSGRQSRLSRIPAAHSEMLPMSAHIHSSNTLSPRCEALHRAHNPESLPVLLRSIFESPTLIFLSQFRAGFHRLASIKFSGRGC